MSRAVEKRNHIRVPLTFVSVDIYAKDRTIESSETCSIIDISENGMKFVTVQHFDIGKSVVLTFILPGSSIPIQASAVVIHQQPYNSLFSTGVRFSVVGIAEFTLLKMYIETLTVKN